MSHYILDLNLTKKLFVPFAVNYFALQAQDTALLNGQGIVNQIYYLLASFTALERAESDMLLLCYSTTSSQIPQQFYPRIGM